MNKKEDFNFLVEQAMEVQGYAHMRPVITKELLHYDILFALEKEGLLDALTFQGGTSLRLCYRAPRFSEDLDFVGGKDFDSQTLSEIKTCLEGYIGKRYGLEITVKEPREMGAIFKRDGIKVDKWQVGITTSPGRKDLPKQKIKLEVANVPAYSREPKSLQKNYKFLPDGYGDMLIMTETLDEIMADKLVALVSCQRYVRYRDIWDLRWLKQQGATINSDYVLGKINDYSVENYLDKLNKMLEDLDDIVRGEGFSNEMSRFIPLEIQQRTLNKSKFLDFLISENSQMLLEVKNIIEGGVSNEL